jgi:predicted RNA-binding protein YlxR (DUF448 family)
MKKHIPIRMCSSCRARFPQKNLLRLQKNGDKALKYRGVGRSFYICYDCLENDKHILNKISGRLKIDINSLDEVIKELKNNVED